MKKIIFLTTIVAGLVLAAGIGYAGSLDTQVICPVSVSAGANIVVTAGVYNKDGVPVTVSSYATFIAGNSQGTQGGTLGLWGPYPKTFSPSRSVPAFGTRTWAITIGKAPSGVSGSLVLVGFEFIDNGGQPFGGGACQVKIN